MSFLQRVGSSVSNIFSPVRAPAKDIIPHDAIAISSPTSGRGSSSRVHTKSARKAKALSRAGTSHRKILKSSRISDNSISSPYQMHNPNTPAKTSNSSRDGPGTVRYADDARDSISSDDEPVLEAKLNHKLNHDVSKAGKNDSRSFPWRSITTEAEKAKLESDFLEDMDEDDIHVQKAYSNSHQNGSQLTVHSTDDNDGEEEDDEEDRSAEIQYLFTRLLNHRWVKDEIQLQVDWYGSSSTWEPECNIHQDAPEALFEYWRKQGGRPQNPRDPEIFDIFAIRKHSKDKRRLFIEWTGYGPEESTWVARRIVEKTAPEFLADYWKRVGTRN